MKLVAKICLVTMLVFSSFAVVPTPSHAVEVEILVQKLVEKGVISPGDAQQVLTETKEEVRKQLAKGDVEGVPKWTQRIKLKGDFRARYEYQEQQNTNGRDLRRHRGRVRLRLGAEAKVTKNVKVGFGLASGGTDPRSTNETLDNSFETPDIRLDYAYGEYKPFDWGKIVLGKFKNQLWRPSDLLWDSDVRPDGAHIQIKKKPIKNLELFFNAGFYIIDEGSRVENDPYMLAFQPGVKWKSKGKKYDFKFAPTMYVTDVSHKALPHSPGTNKLNDAAKPADWVNALQMNYNCVGLSAEFGINDFITGKLPFDVPRMAIIGDYVQNIDTSEENRGYLIGIKFGDKKVKKKGQWQLKYMYRRLERDAWLDFLPDSDAQDGDTGAHGHELAFKYGLANNWILGLDYYHMQYFEGSPLGLDTNFSQEAPSHLLQVDLNYKFG